MVLKGETIDELLAPLDCIDAKTAKAYILYRAEHTKRRNAESYLMEIYKTLTYAPAIEEDIKRENANIDGDTAMGTMLRYGSEAAKQFSESFLMKPEYATAHERGDIHIHETLHHVLLVRHGNIQSKHALVIRQLHTTGQILVLHAEWHIPL